MINTILNSPEWQKFTNRSTSRSPVRLEDNGNSHPLIMGIKISMAPLVDTWALSSRTHALPGSKLTIPLEVFALQKLLHICTNRCTQEDS